MNSALRIRVQIEAKDAAALAAIASNLRAITSASAGVTAAGRGMSNTFGGLRLTNTELKKMAANLRDVQRAAATSKLPSLAARTAGPSLGPGRTEYAAAVAEGKAAAAAEKTQAKSTADYLKQQWNSQVAAAKQAKQQQAQAAKAEAAAEKTAIKEVSAAQKTAQAQYTAALKNQAAAERDVAAKQAGLKTAQAAAQVSGFNAALTRSTDHITNWGKNIQWIGRQLQYNFSAPLERLGKVGFANLMKVGEATTMLQRVYGDAGSSAQQFAQDQAGLEKAFRLLSDTYGQSLADVTQLGASWAAAGLTGGDLARAVKNTMDVMILANGEFANQEDAFKALIAIQTAYSLSSKGLTDGLAVMNVIANKTAVQFTDLVTGVSKAGGSARTAGVTIRELSAMMAALVPATGSADTAANGLKTTFSRLLAPTKQAASALKDIGINVDSDKWQTQTATQRLQTMADAFDGLKETQKAWVVTQVAGRFQLNRIDVLLKAVQDPLSAYNQALNATVDTQENAAKMNKQYQDSISLLLKSTPQGFKIMQTQLQNLLMDVLIPLLPWIQKAAHFLVGLMSAFNNLSPGIRNAIITGLAFIAVIGPVMRIVGAFAELLGVFGKLGNLIGWVVSLFTSTTTPAVAAAAAASSVAEANLAAANSAVIMADANLAAWEVSAQAAGTSTAVQVEAIASLDAAKQTLVAANIEVAASAEGAAAAESASWLAAAGPIIAVVAAVAAAVAVVYIFREQIGHFLSDLWADLSQAALQLRDIFVDLWNGAVSITSTALSFFPRAVAATFEAVVNIIARAAKAVYKWLSYFNPFARHSPSLVESVNAGVDIIAAKYKSLAGIGATFRRAAADFAAFKAATAGTRAGFDSSKQKEQRDTIVKATPSAAPQVDQLYSTLGTLKSALQDVADQWAKQKIVVDAAEIAYKALDDQVDAASNKLDALRKIQDGLSDQLAVAKDRYNEYANAQVAGTKAWDDAIFENNMAQKALKLQIMQLEDQAGVSYDDIANRIAAVNGEIETVQGTIAGLRQQGAGSDVLKPYLDQLESLQGQQGGLSGTYDQINTLQAALDDLQHTGDMLDLEKALALDPLNKQIDDFTNNVKEMPFDEIMAGLRSSKTDVDNLTKAYDDATKAVADQQKVVDDLTTQRDALKDTYDAEKKQLDELSAAYDAIENQIQDITQALEDMASAAKDAAGAGGGGGGAGGGGGMPDASFEDPTTQLDGVQENLQSFIDEMEKNMGKIDLLSPFKKIWKKLTDWLHSDGVKDFFMGFLTIREKVIQWFKDLGSNVYGWMDEFGNKVHDWVVGIPGKIGDIATLLYQKGFDLVQGLWDGLVEKAAEVMQWFLDLPANAIAWIGEVLPTLRPKGFDFIAGLLAGIVDKAKEVITWFQQLPGNVVTWVGDVARSLWSKGMDFIGGLKQGLEDKEKEVITWLVGLPARAADSITGMLTAATGKGAEFIKGIWDGMIGLWEGVEGVGRWITSLPQKAIDALGDFATKFKNALVSGFKTAWNDAADAINGLTSHIPTIYIPGLDITIEAPTIPHLYAQGGIVPGYSGQAVSSIVHGGEVVLNARQQSSLLWAMANQARGTYAMSQTGSAQQAGGGSRTLVFNGDLSFPNIKSGDDAEKFIRNLESLASS